ncbi:uncharacterized protein YALI1_F10987g [Yarrowia lipolytica]|uniref:Uncharacterized protein n=1 Tax=Yarrowia lipolytica TaxID=4952 RepID=A0A1D8NMG8_YARLL|nr:hypothetical protein YALI1_F10987g [Yarrowia lipolytica]
MDSTRIRTCDICCLRYLIVCIYILAQRFFHIFALSPSLYLPHLQLSDSVFPRLSAYHSSRTFDLISLQRQVNAVTAFSSSLNTRKASRWSHTQ